MIVAVARIHADRISDWETFHDEFNRVFQFPSFYGRNMNAWIDCMSSLDAPDEGMTGIHAADGRVLTIEVENAKLLRDSCPEQYAALVECTAFVNWRRIEQGGSAVLALSYRI
ncbi:MAG TPA: barstar family protein [Polyangiaceae bacterium]|nr:barstar family protein [Polyangiaceae bacterium]